MRKKLPLILGKLSKFAPRIAASIAFHYFATPIRTPRPESEKLWHETAKKYFLKNGTAAFEWGNPDGALVILIHGWNGRGTQLASFANSLVEKNFRVVALDGPGHGISSGKKTNPSHFAQFIIDAQKELISTNESQAVIAHSFGGSSTVLAVSRGLKTKGIVLIASPAFYDRVVDYFVRSMNLSPSSVKIFFELVTKATGLPPKELNIGIIGAKLNLPVLIVHDEVDNAVDYLSAKSIHETWPGSKLLTTQGLGHRRILKDKAVITNVTNFIVALGRASIPNL
ncbi:MAG: alpha/beta hydrolase [Bacteriovorax sp.]|nr:alpha/beta hydrolase [Bacteriovorax sp.]